MLNQTYTTEKHVNSMTNDQAHLWRMTIESLKDTIEESASRISQLREEFETISFEIDKINEDIVKKYNKVDDDL